MKHLVMSLLLLGGLQALSQEERDSVSTYPQFQNVLCLDEQTPFPEDLRNVNDMEIIYFNRWGEVLGKSADKNGYLQEALSGYKLNGETEVVTYLIKYETKFGEKKEIYGQFTLFLYCNGD